jgi:hypothetical protein
MDIRLVAYKNFIEDTVITSTNTISSSTNQYVLNNIGLDFSAAPAGTTPEDYFAVGQEIYNSNSQLVGVVTVVTSSPSYALTIQGAFAPLLGGSTLMTQVAYTYDLDLQDNASVSLNFQFTDTKEPEKRKASYSQTFKLPFTDNNNRFFENWYNVNIVTLNYNTQTQVDAVLYSGSTSQFEGVLQLKAVYLTTGVYEVVLLSNSASLFNSMGTKTVRDAFPNWDLWQFNYTYENIGYSWDGGTELFVNIFGDSFKDTDYNVQKVMFPLQVSNPGFIYPLPTAGDGHMRMDQGSIDSIVSTYGDVTLPAALAVPIHQFKPAIQLKTILKQIIHIHGFTYTSDFIDSEYFSRLYMTTCNHTGVPHCTILQTPGLVDGSASAGFISLGGANYGQYINQSYDDDFTYSPWQTLVVNQNNNDNGLDFPSDPDGLFNLTYNAYKRTDENMVAMNCRSKVELENLVAQNDNGCAFRIQIEALHPQTFVKYDEYTEYSDIYYDDSINTTDSNQVAEFVIAASMTSVPVGWYARFKVRVSNLNRDNYYADGILTYGVGSLSGAGVKSRLEVEWTGYYDNVYNKIVNTIAGIDPSLKQKDFLKDMIQRFNLVIVPDRENPTDLKIEPFTNYMASGEMRNWTDKLDVNKDIKIKDTLSLQKASVEFTDSEDEDLKNKSIKEFASSLNVYGHKKIINTNEFAKGEQKYQSPFSPYINEQVFSTNQGGNTAIPRMVIQYEMTYEQVDNVYVDRVSPVTKPKLFYYSGKKTNVFNDPTQNYYLHRFTVDLDSYPTGIIPYGFTDYPLCTPFELEVEDGAEGTIGVTTRSLYWSKIAPELSNSPMFNYQPYGQFEMSNSLYYAYWRKFTNQIYDEDTKIVECSLYLNAVDIFQFRFYDEIFIKDQYYQILEIKNYQVGGNESTKVTLMTLNDNFEETCLDCDFVLGEPAMYAGETPQNTWNNTYVWCSSTDEDCINGTTPPSTDSSIDAQIAGTYLIGLMTTEACCDCAGGMFEPVDPAISYSGFTPFSQWAPNTGKCKPVANSLTPQIADIYRVKNIFTASGGKRYVNMLLGGYSRSLSTGTNRDKFSYNLLPEFGDDIKIQYSGSHSNIGSIIGESHRLVLLGKTTGTTKSYAYINGTGISEPLYIPFNSIVNIRVRGISTVIGGTSTTYPIGSTEAFAYYTAFKNEGTATHTVTQLGTANGTAEYSLKEGGLAQTCTLEIDSGDDKSIRFGIKDADADAVRMWQLTVDYDVNNIANMGYRIDVNYAEYENGVVIGFQDTNELLWN